MNKVIIPVVVAFIAIGIIGLTVSGETITEISDNEVSGLPSEQNEISQEDTAQNYKIKDICEWATLVSEQPNPINFVMQQIPDGELGSVKEQAYQSLLRNEYEEWEIEGGFVPMEKAQEFMDQAYLIKQEYLIDEVTEYYDVNPELKPLLFSRYATDNFDEEMFVSQTVDYMLHPDFYGNNLKCEKTYLENNDEKVYNLLIHYNGEQSAKIVFDEIKSRVY